MYDLYLAEKEYDATQVEKSGTTEGAIAGWDMRGRGSNESTEDKCKRLRAIADVKVKEPWRKKLADKIWDAYKASIPSIDRATGHGKGKDPYRENALTLLDALNIVLLGDKNEPSDEYPWYKPNMCNRVREEFEAKRKI